MSTQTLTEDGPDPHGQDQRLDKHEFLETIPGLLRAGRRSVPLPIDVGGARRDSSRAEDFARRRLLRPAHQLRRTSAVSTVGTKHPTTAANRLRCADSLIKHGRQTSVVRLFPAAGPLVWHHIHRRQIHGLHTGRYRLPARCGSPPSPRPASATSRRRDLEPSSTSASMSITISTRDPRSPITASGITTDSARTAHDPHQRRAAALRTPILVRFPPPMPSSAS